MIIKSHVRAGYRAAADYLKDIGENETTRLVSISDLHAKDLDEAFQNMWAVACNSRVQKPLHHISINPYGDERLTDEQVLKIVKRCEEKYGYKDSCHQRVIVEHVKDGRQHFHVMWNRVSMDTGKAVWPGLHWKNSKEVAREMEKELGLKCPVSKRTKNTANFRHGIKRQASYKFFQVHFSYSYKAGSKSKNTRQWNARKLPSNVWCVSNIPNISTSLGRPIHIRRNASKCSQDTNNSKASQFLPRLSSGRATAIRIFSSNSFNRIRHWNTRGCTTSSKSLVPVAHSYGPAALVKAARLKAEQFNWLLWHRWKHEPDKNGFTPLRPVAHSAMSEAQRIDMKAAEEGKITWAEYFQKWGKGSLAL